MLSPLEQASEVCMWCSSSALAKIHTVLKCSRPLLLLLSQAISFILPCQSRSVFHPYPFFWCPDLTFTAPLRHMIWKNLLFVSHFYVGLLFHNSFLSNHSFVPLILFNYNSTHVEVYNFIKYIILYILSQFGISLNVLSTAVWLPVFLVKYLDNN